MQHDFDLTTADANTGPTMRIGLNAMAQALASCSSGPTEPSTMYAYQFWADTTSGYMKQRNAANNAWLTRWQLSAGQLAALAGATFTGLVNLAAGANIASAATLDLTAATGNCPRITGTTATSAVTMNTGQQMVVVADGAWPLTYHQTANKINTRGVNYTCNPGDVVFYSKDASGIVHGIILANSGPGVSGVGAVLDANAAGTGAIFTKFTSAYSTKFGTVYRNAALGTDNSMAIVQTGGATPTWEVMDVSGQDPNADLTTGYSARFKITYGVGAAVTGTLSATENVALATTKKLYLDGVAGNGNTYLVESSPDVCDIYVGGVKVLSLNTTTAAVVGALTTTGALTITENTGSSIKAIGCYTGTTAVAANLNVDSSGFFTRSTSSIKYKKNVQDSAHGLADLLKLRPVTYMGKAKKDGDTVFGGLIAEEVHDAGLTEFVQYADDGSPDALAYGNMVSLCIGAIKELNARIVALEAK